MPTQYGVVDLFAGPGGLAEGFSRIAADDGTRPFKMELSVEMESSAHRTLLLRSFLRQFDTLPGEYIDALNQGIHQIDWKSWAEKRGYAAEWAEAEREALQLTLADEAGEAAAIVDERIRELRRKYHGDLILVGGPPCQAYSLVGRSRNMGKADYVAEEDHRHYLYREYIRILELLQPAVFVMENVKGILSSTLNGTRVFDMIREDLENIGRDGSGSGYRLVPIAAPATPSLFGSLQNRDFIVRSEDHGVPQARHRVIVVGVRSDLAGQFPEVGLLASRPTPVAVRDVIGEMPPLRAGISRTDSTENDWRLMLFNVMARVRDAGVDSSVRDEISALWSDLEDRATPPRSTTTPDSVAPVADHCLKEWLSRTDLTALPGHEARGHMRTDLERYFFAATYGQVHGQSPKAGDFPASLAPDHANWTSGKFADRFRVQLACRPSTTVTSHISKDGHYFIHPDPIQCRSLTVREAARLQTFPDDYIFLGNRTQQFVQVGNAVPPYLAHQIAASILDWL